MSSAQSPKRYPKRKRVQVSYTETIDSEELGEDVNTVPLIKDDPDNDIDWKTAAKKASKSKARKKEHRKAAKKSIFPFMKLPPELRNNIYKHCLLTPGGVNLSLQRVQPPHPRKALMQSVDTFNNLDWLQRGIFSATSTRNLGLLRVSKCIYQEAVGMVYSQEFCFKTLPAMWSFLYSLSPETKNLLRHIEVKPNDNEWNSLPGVTRELPVKGSNLECLKIHNLSCHVGTGSPRHHLQGIGFSLKKMGTSLEVFDKVLGIVLAKDAYDFMWPFINEFVREHGVERLVDILDLFKTRPRPGYKFFAIEHHFPSSVTSKPWSKARGVTARAAMIEQMRNIIERDNR